MASDACKFATTRWSVVLRAGNDADAESAALLEELCRSYWRPIYYHVRRRGHNPEDAQDLTQEFFARFLAKQWIRTADAQRGRFRSFVLGALNHFLADEWDRTHRLKRGGGQRRLCCDFDSAEDAFFPDNHTCTPEQAFDRNWALRVLERAQCCLRREYTSHDTPVTYEMLEQFLPGEEGPLTYAQAAARLERPEGTLKSDVHRFKRRFGQLLREEIARSVASPQEVDDELRYLIAVLGR